MAYDELAAHSLELLQPLGAVRSRRMFGGHGIYVDDLFIALIVFDRLFLKADEHTRARFEAAGCEPFVYEGAGSKKVSVSYYTVPAEAMESPAAMQPWARLAIDAALRARAAKKPQAKPRKAKPKLGAVRGKAAARRV
jgi:DNA transformation protein